MTLDSFRELVRRLPSYNGQVWMNADDAAEILVEAGLSATSSMLDGLIIYRDPTKARGEVEFRV